MARKTLDLDGIISADTLANEIAHSWVRWDEDRREQVERWSEIQKYIFQTDTRQTSNVKLPWKNTTTVPKICQIRDNLAANYRTIMFPKRKWMKWLPDTKEDAAREKANVVRNYITHVIDQSEFKNELDKFIYDYIDYGNCFAMPEWVDNRVEQPDGSIQEGYVGPKLTRIAPTDIVMNPLASSEKDSTFIVRSFVTIGEFKKRIQAATGDEREELEKIFQYMRDIRKKAAIDDRSAWKHDDAIYSVAGFDNFRTYLQSNYVEILTFYGDMYDIENDELYENHVITVVDRHKLVSKKPNQTILGFPTILHSGWRKRQGNLWAMGPLDNLIGMQYRIDHLENMKADVLDLTVFPPIKIKGYVEDFIWGPGERIYILDDGDVELMGPDVKVLQVNMEIEKLMQLMEEMAGAPKEALGFRTPGEKTAYEVQRLENAASRVFQNRASAFEEEFIEPGLNMLLELGRRRQPTAQMKIFDEENKVFIFSELTKEDISGAGRIRPIGARHFAEQAEIIQNLNNFSNSAMAQDPLINVHFSGKKTAMMLEDLLGVEEYNLVTPYIRIAEQQEMERMNNAGTEQTLMQAETPAGLQPDDYDDSAVLDAMEQEQAQSDGNETEPPADTVDPALTGG